MVSSEGRIRPSYIAARASTPAGRNAQLRGANSPLLHCGVEGENIAERH